MKTREYKGVYLQTTCCTSCDWYASGDYGGVGMIPKAAIDQDRHCCPKCADDITNTRGRYIFKETRSFFGGKRTEVIGFEKLLVNDQPDVPTPNGFLVRCLKGSCMSVYKRTEKYCPWCGTLNET